MGISLLLPSSPNRNVNSPVAKLPSALVPFVIASFLLYIFFYISIFVLKKVCRPDAGEIVFFDFASNVHIMNIVLPLFLLPSVYFPSVPTYYCGFKRIGLIAHRNRLHVYSLTMTLEL